MIATANTMRLALAICEDLIRLTDRYERGEMTVASRDLSLSHIETRARLIVEWVDEVRGHLREQATPNG